MKDLEVFRLSATTCKGPMRVNVTGDAVYWEDYPGEWHEWNPFTNAEQRWQCVEKLLEMGDIRCTQRGDHEWFQNKAWPTNRITASCPASEFPARALAELQRRKGES